MKTTKAFSTISYNTTTFLITKLDTLIKQQKITFYCFITHYPEEDETKKHIHLFIEPNGQIDTDMFKDYLMELDPANVSKPLGIMPIRKSVFADWYLYVIHDIDYLLTKGQTRKYHYTDNDIYNSCQEYFLESKHTINYNKYNKTKNIIDALRQGQSAIDLVSTGQINLQQFSAVQKIQDNIFYNVNICNRNDRQTHSPKENINLSSCKMIPQIMTDSGEIIDTDTGEIL